MTSLQLSKLFGFRTEIRLSNTELAFRGIIYVLVLVPYAVALPTLVKTLVL